MFRGGLRTSCILAIGVAAGCGGDAGVDSVAFAAPPPAEGTPMTSPRMAESHELAGEWRLTLPGGRACAVRLIDEFVPELNAYRLEAAACAADPVLATAAGWRPNPLGLEFAGRDGLTLIDFETTGAGVLTASRSQGFTLRR